MNRPLASASSCAMPSSLQVVTLKMYRGPFKNYNYLVVDHHSGQAVIVDPAWQINKIDRALTLARLLQQNIYLHFTCAADFATFRLRKGQNKLNWFRFRWAG